jgi:hypothetical protein
MRRARANEHEAPLLRARTRRGGAELQEPCRARQVMQTSAAARENGKIRLPTGHNPMACCRAAQTAPPHRPPPLPHDAKKSLFGASSTFSSAHPSPRSVQSNHPTSSGTTSRNQQRKRARTHTQRSSAEESFRCNKNKPGVTKPSAAPIESKTMSESFIMIRPKSLRSRKDKAAEILRARPFCVLSLPLSLGVRCEAGTGPVVAWFSTRKFFL